MVDPFTLATGIAGLLKLTIELTKIINEYTGSVKNAPKEAQELFKGLSALGHVLEQLNRFLCSENAKPNSFDHTCVLCFATNTCQDKLQSALRKFMKMSEGSKWSQNFERLKWPLDKQENLHTVDTLHRCAQTFQFSLTIDGW
jgi:hypothetical protein